MSNFGKEKVRDMTFEQMLDFAPDLEEYTRHMPEEIKTRVFLRKYEPYTLIHQKGSVLNRFGVVIRGRHRVVNEFENGGIFMVEENEAISFIGEVTLLAEEEITSVTIETITECYVMCMSISDFWLWIKNDSHFLKLLSRDISRKLYHSSSNRGERVFYSAKYLLLKYIVDRAERQGIHGQKSIIIGKTRQQISEEIGMTTKTINRILSNFANEEIIHIHKGKIQMNRVQYENAPNHLNVLAKQAKNGLTTP